MGNETIEKNLFGRIIDVAPRSLMVLLAYICLIPIAISLSLNMAHIRVDDYANGLLKIALMKAEIGLTPAACEVLPIDQSLINQVNENALSIQELYLDNEILKENSHKPSGSQ